MTDPLRVIRGGSWSFAALSLRAWNRSGSVPSRRNRYMGFRLVRSGQ